MQRSSVFVNPNLSDYIITPSVLKQYLYFEKYGYPQCKIRLSTKVVQAFVDWADQNIRRAETILLFKPIFEKVILLFQESEIEINDSSVATEISA